MGNVGVALCYAGLIFPTYTKASGYVRFVEDTPRGDTKMYLSLPLYLVYKLHKGASVYVRGQAPERRQMPLD